jgi:hypothetical protein
MICRLFGTVLHGEAVGPVLGAVALGAVHGVEPGRGWPVAPPAHSISSVATGLAFFGAKSYESSSPLGDGHAHSRGARLDRAATRRLLDAPWFAFLPGFAHEEEFEIVVSCLLFAHAVPGAVLTAPRPRLPSPDPSSSSDSSLGRNSQVQPTPCTDKDVMGYTRSMKHTIADAQ